MTQELMDLAHVGAKRTGHHAGGHPQKYYLSEPDRRLILAVYGNPKYGSVSESIDYLLDRIPVPRRVIKRWGAQLGLARTKERPWSSEELAYLRENYQRPSGQRASLRSIAQYLGRTKDAVHIKATRMKYRRYGGDAYTFQSLADALGCDSHKVKQWVEKKWLDASLEHSREDGRYAIAPTAIRRFIIEHPSEIDHRRADWLWLLDILIGDTDRIGGPEPRGPKGAQS
jgi:hypothetical protein